MRSVLCAMMLICSVPIVTPVMPPKNPNTTTEKISDENPGSPQGALRSQPNRPSVNPRSRMPSSSPAGTVKPCTIDASTAMYMKYDVFTTFHAGPNPGSTNRWWADAMEMNRMYSTNADRLTFSLSTTAPTVSAPSMYQIATIAATL